MSEQTVWHYTKSVHIPKILADRLIKPATLFVPLGERPIVWFSTNAEWERSVHDREVLLRMGIAPCRIAVCADVAPYSFNELRKRSGMRSKTAHALVDVANSMGADPWEWRATFESVPAERWLNIEVWDGARWIGYEEVVD